MYDALNRRIGTDVSGTQTWFVYDGQNSYADFNGSGTLLTRYLYGPAVDAILARTSSGGTSAWYLTDRLGTIRDLTNTSGTVIDHVVYGSFGKITSETNTANGDRFKFSGREYDAGTGLYYYRARYYETATGRFVSRDPLGFSARDLNTYRYVFNQPTDTTDPSGEVIPVLIMWAAPVIIGAALGAIGATAVYFATDPNATWEGAIGPAGKGALVGAASAALGMVIGPAAASLIGNSFAATTAGLALTGAMTGAAVDGLIQIGENAYASYIGAQPPGWNWQEMLVSAGIGAVCFPLGSWANKWLRGPGGATPGDASTGTWEAGGPGNAPTGTWEPGSQPAGPGPIQQPDWLSQPWPPLPPGAQGYGWLDPEWWQSMFPDQPYPPQYRPQPPNPNRVGDIPALWLPPPYGINSQGVLPFPRPS